MAGIGPEDIDLAQLQDTETGAEIMHMAENGFCEHGEQEAMIQAGETEIGGRFPVNTDGGCLANGEPIGASGLRQVYENVLQLRGDAGVRQVPGRPADRVHPRLRRAGHLRRHDPRPADRVRSIQEPVPESTVPVEFLCRIDADTVSIPPQMIIGGPQGSRMIASVAGGTFEGPKAKGTIPAGSQRRLGDACGPTARSASTSGSRSSPTTAR